MKRSLALTLALGAPIAALAATVETAKPQTMDMTVDGIDRILRQHATEIKRDGNAWQFNLMGVPMACITDPAHDRMRIVAPIVRVADIGAEQKDAMLEANFHSALDVRYATSGGVVYAAFIHPPSPLRDGELVSALRQVAQAALTFGDSYSSSDLVFGAP